MAEPATHPRPVERARLAGRVGLATVATLAVVAGGGAAIALSPLLIAALTGAVIVVAVALLWWRPLGPGRRRGPGTAAVLGHFALAGAVVLVAIQGLPYGREHSNPPVTGEPRWSSPRTRQLMVDACYDCHSNEVEWPWYTDIAPMSWAATEHVDEGREAVNYSEFTTGGDHEADETVEVILEGSMPPFYYTLFGLHPEADLSRDEIAELVAGLRATPGLDEDEDQDQDDDDEDDEDD